jgi:drug/metabolite transporter (DMT)-like permease
MAALRRDPCRVFRGSGGRAAGFQGIDPDHVYAFLATATYSGFSILTRLMGSSQSQESMMIMPSLVALVVMAPPVLALSPVPDLPLHWVLMLLMGGLNTVGQFLMLSAYRRASASDVAPYIYAQMVWGVSLGWLLFAELPDRWTIAGSAVIAASGLYLVLRDRRIAEAEVTTRAS